MMLGVHLMSN
jgi:hypothetical protein